MRIQVLNLIKQNLYLKSFNRLEMTFIFGINTTTRIRVAKIIQAAQVVGGSRHAGAKKFIRDQANTIGVETPHTIISHRL